MGLGSLHVVCKFMTAPLGLFTARVGDVDAGNRAGQGDEAAVAARALRRVFSGVACGQLRYISGARALNCQALLRGPTWSRQSAMSSQGSKRRIPIVGLMVETASALTHT